MPQFDIVVYSNELLWVFFFFFLIYSFNYLFFFPRIVEILKTRKKKIENDLVILELTNKRVSKIFNVKENLFFRNVVSSSFNDFISFCSIIGFFENLHSLNSNLKVKYFLGGFYNYFDFYEIESL